jgi:hypothetical protein
MRTGAIVRSIILLGVLCAGCCLSPETKILSRRISDSTAKQRTELVELANMKLEIGKKISETPRGKLLLKRAEKLEEATSGLADLLGAPKEIE